MPTWSTRSEATRDVLSLLLVGLTLGVVHMATNGQYGFHRDELQILDDARHLAWGYPTYPPLTPFIERVAFELFGPSLVGLRSFSVMAQGVVLVLTGLMARDMGGRRITQIVAALAVAIAPVALFSGTEFQYTSFDYLWWVSVACLVVRLLKSDDPRWTGPGIGFCIGLGLMTKYAILFFVVGLVGGFLLTPARRYLKSRWIGYGAGLALLICLPNLSWQVQHHFMSLDFLRTIHARDIRLGRTGSFIADQFTICTNAWTVPLWGGGLAWLFAAPDARRYRPLAWMFVIPFLLLLLAHGRGYYLGPAYPMLLAAGAVAEERWLRSWHPARARRATWITFTALAIGSITAGRIILPIWPVQSPENVAIRDNGALREEVGWQELVGTVAAIRDALPAEERDHVGILAGNYGEAGAIDLYGPEHGLPPAICGTNAFWLRGYPDPAPQVLIVVGCSRSLMESYFVSCQLVGHNVNPYGIENEESRDHPDIFLCRKLRQSWPEFWKDFQMYG